MTKQLTKAPASHLVWRRCCACRQPTVQHKAFRFRRVTPGGAIRLQTTEKFLAGRSAYCCANESCLNLSFRQKGKALQRALKCRIADAIVTQLYSEALARL